MRAGERFAAEFGLGAAPATRLSEAMERELGILVLMVDADRDISGAACRLREMDAVLIARREVAGRRHFDLAHELFHILTWDAMPPEHSEAAQETDGNRVEQLANNFAAAVLMPSASLRRFDGWAGRLIDYAGRHTYLDAVYCAKVSITRWPYRASQTRPQRSSSSAGASGKGSRGTASPVWPEESWTCFITPQRWMTCDHLPATDSRR